MKPHDGNWRFGSGKQQLVSKEVHVWRAKLNKPISDLTSFESILAKDEIKRANRFHFVKDRRRYIVKQAVLRFILGKFYLDCEPRALRFGVNPYGKPHLNKEFDRDHLFFNMAVSNELALFALAKNPEIGVDIEYMRSLPDATEIVAQSFSKAENTAFQAVPQHKKQEAFFNCWTRKEAFIKATGKGMYYPLNSFEVSISSDEATRIISIENDFQKADEWSLVSMIPSYSYIGALAVKENELSIKFWTYPD